MTRCDDDQPGDTAATALLVLRTSEPDASSLARLNAALDQRGFQRGHLVGPVLPVTASSDSLQSLADHVEVAAGRQRPADGDADTGLLEALVLVEHFAWDEGAESL